MACQIQKLGRAQGVSSLHPHVCILLSGSLSGFLRSSILISVSLSLSLSVCSLTSLSLSASLFLLIVSFSESLFHFLCVFLPCLPPPLSLPITILPCKLACLGPFTPHPFPGCPSQCPSSPSWVPPGAASEPLAVLL